MPCFLDVYAVQEQGRTSHPPLSLQESNQSIGSSPPTLNKMGPRAVTGASQEAPDHPVKGDSHSGSPEGDAMARALLPRAA